jgi:hypothetical protein
MNINNQIVGNQFVLPFNAYAAFDAVSLKQLMQQRLNEGGVFTDQIFEGSNFNSLLDVIAYSYHVLLFYLNKTSSESLFSQAQLFENMNKIVKTLGYNPIGNQTSVLPFNCSADAELPKGVYTIPRYSYLTVNGVNYSLQKDATFVKSTDSLENLNQFTESNLLHQGTFKEYPLYVATGEPFEEITLAVVDENGNNELLDHSSIDVYVYNSKTLQWNQFSRVETLYLEAPPSLSYECRLNENQRYVIKFGDDVTGKKLLTGDVVAIYYLKSDGSRGEVGPDVINGNSLFLFNTVQFNQIYPSISKNLNLLNSNQINLLNFSNELASTFFKTVENVDSMRKNSSNTFKSQYRLITTEDFTNYINSNFSNIINDVKVVNNWEYLAEHVRYLYNLGLKSPNQDSRVAYNQLTFADSCDFNNIYVYVVPKLHKTNSLQVNTNFLATGLKTNIINTLQDVKMMTSEIIIMDPIYIAVSLGVGTPEEINNKLLTTDIANESFLVIGRSPNSRFNEIEIKQTAYNILSEYFDVKNNKLGQKIDADLITRKILDIEGVTSVVTTRTVNEQAITSIGLSLLLWNPVYSNSNEDISITTQPIKLSYFKIPYFYNLTNLLDYIKVVTPDVQEASLREY